MVKHVFGLFIYRLILMVILILAALNWTTPDLAPLTTWTLIRYKAKAPVHGYMLNCRNTTIYTHFILISVLTDISLNFKSSNDTEINFSPFQCAVLAYIVKYTTINEQNKVLWNRKQTLHHEILADITMYLFAPSPWLNQKMFTKYRQLGTSCLVESEKHLA